MKLVKLEERRVLNLFRVGKKAKDIIADMYGMVFGPASKIVSMEGVPTVSLETGAKITHEFKLLGDEEAALWIQFGFHTEKGVPDWFVNISDVNITS